MSGQLAIGSALLVLSIAVHTGFMVLAARFVRRHLAWLHRPPSFVKRFSAVCAVSLWLSLAMSFTVLIWALCFLWVGALRDLETAIYFSLVSFTTLGFGDIVLARPHRLYSGMLAANGLVLFGITTAVLVDVMKTLLAPQSPTNED